MPEAQTLNRQKGAAQSILTGANFDQNIETSDWGQLVVEVDMSAGVAADLVVELAPVSEVNDEVYPIVLPPIQNVVPTLSGGRSYLWARYDVSGQQRVRLRIRNANAATQTADWAWRLAP